jgi:hypothetical protein
MLFGLYLWSELKGSDNRNHHHRDHIDGREERGRKIEKDI